MHHYLNVNSKNAEPEKRFSFVVSPKYDKAELTYGTKVMSRILILSHLDDLIIDKPWAVRFQDLADRFIVTRTIREPRVEICRVSCIELVI